ncbi:15096_t:CDS:10 [Dentiscutata heterogama]|uniref:15096_t:CDS:1 n=1 Tax=Dentiscutata heterogama TaxID=1316150 RepID=A0ACA9KWM1_9GLOM|nr:15096_t:CDS:10 [Dentiscutata heterogama]
MIPQFFTYRNNKNELEKDSYIVEQPFTLLDKNIDMYIIAGFDWNRRIFKVHTSILKDRCDYFKKALSNKCIRKNSDGIIVFYKEDISPEIFKLILDYIYTGVISIGLYDTDVNILDPIIDADEKIFSKSTGHHDTDVNILDFIIAADEMLLPKLVSSLESLLIDKYFKQFSPELEAWIICLITINKDQFLPRFEERIYKIGLTFIKGLIPINVNTEIEPSVYINALLETRRMYINMLTAFRGDANFIISLDKVFQKIVNQNHVTGTSTTKSPQLLALFCDSLLRKDSDKSDLKDVMTLFKYVEDKDIFIKFYSMLLAKRLINGTSLSEDAEQNLISKLKVIDFSILVLGTAFWPFKPSITSFIIPKELEGTFKTFKKFYQNKHPSRKLNWLFHLSKGELETNYCKKSYTFMVSTYQMGILLQYNKNTSYTFEELKQKTDLTYSVLTDTLKTLVKTKVLKLSNGTKVGDSLSCYELDTNFKSNKTRIQLNMPIVSEKNEDEIQNVRDSKPMIQGTIIHAMKNRKNVKIVNLINEVTDRFLNRYHFKPKIPEINKCIDILIEKGYIERKSDTLSYVP